MNSSFVYSVSNNTVNDKHSHNYYMTLGCAPDATVEQVLAEYRARVRDYHPDTSLDKSTACREEFLKLKAAKEVLAELNTRMLYDKWLNSALDIPWETWRDRKVLRMSMHWVTSPTPCMISDGNTSNEFEARKLSIPTFSDTLRKFRNYEL